MKWYAALLFVLCLSNGSRAQFYETFDNLSLTAYPQTNLYTAYYTDIPPNWTEHNLDQQALFWVFNARMDGKGFRASLQEVNGIDDTVAIAWSDFGPNGGTADDWLITPSIAVPNLSPSEKAFFLWEHNTYSGDELGYEVLISTGGNAPSDFTTVLWTAPAGGYNTSGFTLNDIDLSAYQGQNIHLAFHYNISHTGWGTKLLLDDFRIKVIEGYDVAVKEVSNLRYQKSTDAQTLDVEIFNWGNPITQLDAILDDGTNTYTMTLSGINIPQFGTYNFQHSTAFSNTITGEYPVSIRLQNINGNNQTDADLSNNEKEMKISVVGNNPVRKVVLEKNTGTWCGWCPRGIVTLDYVSSQITDGTFIPIAVHSQVNDPMTLYEYWDELNVNIAPGCRIDRHPHYHSLSMTPVTTHLDVLEKKGLVTPAEINQTLNYDSNTDNLSINCSATFYTDISTELRFASVIVEDSLSGNTSDWDQANNFSGGGQVMGGFENLPDPVPASQMVYNHVGRTLIGGFHGQVNSITSPIQNGETRTHTFNYIIPDTFKLKDLHVVTFVLDNGTGEILNAISSNLDAFLSTPFNGEKVQNSFNFEVFPSPIRLSSENLNIQVRGDLNQEYHLSIHNLAGKLIFEKALGYVNSNETISIPLPQSLSSGIYMLGLGTSSETNIKKVEVTE